MVANVAIPSFFPHSFATLGAILGIALIEGWFLKRSAGLEFADGYIHSLAANISSTVAGIPAAWLMWMLGMIPFGMGLSVLGIEAHPLVNSILFQSTFMGGFVPNEWSEVGAASGWMVSLVPFWIGSVWIERRALRKRLPDLDPALISRAVVRGNLASYGVFLAFALVALVQAIDGLPARKAGFEEQRQERALRIEQRNRERSGLEK